MLDDHADSGFRDPAAGTMRDRQKAMTRAALLDAAKELFVAEGYAAVTVDDVARAVGCSRATFYLHFANKGDVLAKIGAETMQQRARFVYGDLDDVLRTGDRGEFTAWVRRALDWFDRNRAILPAWDEALAVEPGFRNVGRESIVALTDSMPQYLDRWPVDRRDEARFRVELLVTQLERYFLRAYVQRTIEFDVVAAADVLTDIWFPALTGPITD